METRALADTTCFSKQATTFPDFEYAEGACQKRTSTMCTDAHRPYTHWRRVTSGQHPSVPPVIILLPSLRSQPQSELPTSFQTPLPYKE